MAGESHFRSGWARAGVASWLLVAGCQRYDATSEFADLCEFYARCGDLTEQEVATCIRQHEELYEGVWGEQEPCDDPATHEPLYPEGHFADLCSPNCQEASLAYLLCLGEEGGACESGDALVDACEELRVAYVSACPGLAADEPSNCGNGLQEVGEQCDDGNEIDDDECNNLCVAHCGLLAVASGPPSPEPRIAAAVAVDVHERVIVAGSLGSGDAARLLVEMYDADAALAWQLVLAGELGPQSARALAIDGSDNLIVAGEVRSSPEGDPVAWLGKYGDEGGEVWSQELGEGLVLTGVAAEPGGGILVAGTQEVGTGRRIWLRRLEGAGAEAWTSSFSYDPELPDATTFAGPVVVGPGDDVYVLGSAAADGQVQRALVVRFPGAGGEAIGWAWLPDHGAEQLPRALVSDGESLFVGLEEASDAGVWILGVDPEGAVEFTLSGPEIDAASPPRALGGLVLAADGTLTLGGVGEGRRWIARLETVGDLICATGSELAEGDAAVAAVASMGAAAQAAPLAGGYADVTHESRLWLGHFRP